MSLHSTARVQHRQWGFYGGKGRELGGAGAPLPNFLYPTPWYMLDDTINILIFRVRPHAYYMKGTMKRQKSVYSKFI